ncbi:MAG: gamma-glutamyltransferase [Gemmatimonadales bacterium]|nr:gamma-glutamyltransferase [Gemmatimonadales bacterium]NIN11217.1 gamma-glutamyltransferase [Gemmatimonadales bacterium]NIN49816.1 gamma-glutamyltransferase [Gemmatimonadales bacterium]NIP07280.1 gamma-glutamyltransferase [Gemmatimonadales bacterium]NIR02975.1 gamma-glutamyltransferase [Gemmatimonadales bacterium]
MRRWGAVTAFALAACAGAPTPATPPTPTSLPSAFVPADWPLFDDVVEVNASDAMVSSVHPVASEVGAIIMNRGGNAVDAAVAVGFALAVVHPSAGNIGGGGFMVIRFADGSVYTLDYRETAPSRATKDMYLDSLGKLTDESVTGHLAAGVPGAVAGLAEAQRRFGDLTLAQVMAPAIRIARDGIALDESRSRGLRYAARRLRQFPASARKFLLPNGEAPPLGTLWVQPDLARTLQAIADSGPRVFYEGYIADLIVAEMERGGGLIAKEDLASYRAIWREPIVIRYRGYTIYSMPPVSSGGVTMAEILNILEGFDPLPPFGSVEQVHLLTEAMRRAFVDRNHYLGDPGYVEMPIQRLLSKPYAAELRGGIDADHATPTPELRPGVTEGDHTTHYSVVDLDGIAVSVTTTINGGYGSAVTVEGAGFLLNNEMDDFTGAPGQPNMYGLVQSEANAIEPGKRMLSSMTPSLVLDPQGELLMAVGTPGGPTIITTVAQVISNVIDHGMSLADAIAAPRIHHQALPDRIFYERGALLPEVVARLEAMGHTLVERRGFSGEVAGIIRSGEGWIGVADPRSGGGSVGY